MSKIWIKPLRNLFINNGETVLHEGKAVELDEAEAQELLKNGWAQFAEKPTKPKSSSKNDKTPPETPPATPPATPPETPPATPPDNPDGEQQTGEQPDLSEQTETPAENA